LWLWGVAKPWIRQPNDFRTTPRFETAHPDYAFLNRLVAVASGDRRADGPIYATAPSSDAIMLALFGRQNSEK
jgi:hypothetical protein